MLTGNNLFRALAPTMFATALILVCGSAPARAQQTAPPAQLPTPAPASSPAPRLSPSTTSSTTATEPDLSITARVTARELRFDVVPNPTVEFTGQPRRETVWEADRDNLPRPVQPGVTYRDIGIRLRITSVFADIERIVAEALGEVPLTDDALTPLATPSNQTPPPDSAAPPTTPSAAAPSTSTPPSTATRPRTTRRGTRP